MSHAHCCQNKAKSNVAQSLDEMEFERGIWSAACDNDKAKVEKFLANKDTPVDVRDAAGYTALHYASSRGHLNICELLLKFGADINAETRAGKATALHRAASSGKKSIVELLLQNGCDILKQDADGRTALHRAIINRHYDIAKMLSTVCPNVSSIRDNKNKLAQDYDEK